MGFFNTMRIGATALTAQRLRMDVISNNIANVNTTRTPEGGPYRRQQVVFSPRDVTTLSEAAGDLSNTVGWQMGDGGLAVSSGLGVQVDQIVEDATPGVRAYEPDHPDADADGFVTYPNVNIVTEMVDMMAASRAYEASVAAINAAKSMAQKALELGRV
jgi:flagellar basal-body rod protein FlgC